jgi:hypothetical protein
VDIARLTLLIAALAGLDLVGAVALKEASLRSSPPLMLAGVACFIALAGLLYFALELSELTIVSLAWVVLYQIGAVLVDAVIYMQVPSRVQSLALVVALGALVVAFLADPAPQGKHSTKAPRPVAPMPVRAPVALPTQRTWPTLEERLRERVAERRQGALTTAALPRPRTGD